MSQPWLSVVAEVIAIPGHEDEVRQHLIAVVAPTKEEDGCVQYDLHVSTAEPGHFFFYENWTSAEALARHAASAHIQALGVALKPFVTGPTRVVTCARIA